MRALTMFTTVLAVVLGLSFGAQAATLTITADQAVYQISDTITLTINGDSQGGGHQKSFGTIGYDGLLVSANGGQTQSTLRNGGGTGWIVGGLLVDTPNADTQDSFNQIFGGTVPVDSTKKLTAIMTFHANANGMANFDWRTIGAQALSFFGVTNATGVTVQIGTPVPEPSTAGLMGLGLIGLVIAGRSRKS